MNIYNDFIDVDNYDEILTLTDNLIVLRCNNQDIYIKGSNLSIKKLVDNEMLINGIIGDISFNEK